MQDTTGMLSAGLSDCDRYMMNWQHTSDSLIYLFLCRCLPFYLLAALTAFTKKKTFFHLFCCYIGFIYGTQSLSSALTYQLSGLFLCIFRLLPQILFYIPAFYILWQIAESSRKHLQFKSSRRLFACLLIWTAGAAAEWAINPFFLQFGMKLLL